MKPASCSSGTGRRSIACIGALLERESLERDELVAILGASPAPADGDGIAVAAASGADPDTTVFPTNGSATFLLVERRG